MISDVLSRDWERRTERDSKSKRPGQAGKQGIPYSPAPIAHLPVSRHYIGI